VKEGDRLPFDGSATSAVLQAFSEQGDRTSLSHAEVVKVSLGGYVHDLAGISSPVFGADGRLVGAVTMAGPMSRFDARAVAKMKQALLAATKSLTRQLGGSTRIYEQTAAVSGKRARSARS
jgi:DNA-binding IclR family transcriptional regulator